MQKHWRKTGWEESIRLEGEINRFRQDGMVQLAGCLVRLLFPAAAINICK
jgi:hypothetical protein